MKFCVASAAALAEIVGAEENELVVACVCVGCSKVAGTPILRRSVAEGYSICLLGLAMNGGNWG